MRTPAFQDNEFAKRIADLYDAPFPRQITATMSSNVPSDLQPMAATEAALQKLEVSPDTAAETARVAQLQAVNRRALRPVQGNTLLSTIRLLEQGQ